MSDTTGEKIGTLNPMRYKDYYYDIETGWYYLNSRYYDPDAGRFISPDDVEYLGADGSPNSYNRYAYCGNNPVMYADPSGHLFGLITIGVLAYTNRRYYSPSSRFYSKLCGYGGSVDMG